MSLRSITRAAASAVAALTVLAVAAGSGTPARAAIFPTAPGSPNWYTTSRPISAEGQLQSVSCAGTFCAAVGGASSSDDDESSDAEAYIRDHGSWHQSVVAYPGGRELSAVSCTSPTFCMATEDNGLGAYRWNGRFWGLLRFPVAVPSSVTAISCTSPTFCLAVGHLGNDDDESDSLGAPAVWGWNGSRWAIAVTPKSSAPRELDAVDCLSTTFCMAVGFWDGGDKTHPFAAVFHGRSWVTSTPPVPSIYTDSELASVSCVSTSDCTVAGVESFDRGKTSYAHPYLAKLHPGRWSQVAAPSAPSGNGLLVSVSCVSTSCNGVGAGFGKGGESNPTGLQMFAASSYGGGRWHTVSTPRLTGATSLVFTDSCSTATTCVAVGLYLSRTGDIHEYTMAKD